MYAVIETGGKQFRVAPGQTIEIDTLEGEVGAPVEFERVLALSNESNELLLGDAIGRGAKVLAKITEHGRAPKIVVFKFKRKKQYKRTIGHRQNYTRVKVEEIVA
jgi:large subunit ribosomal protein L21